MSTYTIDLIYAISFKPQIKCIMRKLKFRAVNNTAKLTQLSEWHGLELSLVCLSLRSVLPLRHDPAMEKTQGKNHGKKPLE